MIALGSPNRKGSQGVSTQGMINGSQCNGLLDDAYLLEGSCLNWNEDKAHQFQDINSLIWPTFLEHLL